MSLCVEYANRILAATEDYSIDESKHGQVALESLLLRRCLSTSLWGPSDGVLNQLQGVGQKTAAKLAMNNIRTFADILSKSSNEIEQACGRKSPFGQQLRTAMSKILRRSLSLSAHLEGLELNNSPTILVCNLASRETDKSQDALDTDADTRIVKYTLAGKRVNTTHCFDTFQWQILICNIHIHVSLFCKKCIPTALVDLSCLEPKFQTQDATVLNVPKILVAFIYA